MFASNFAGKINKNPLFSFLAKKLLNFMRMVMGNMA